MSESAHILLVEDNADDAILLERALLRAKVFAPVKIVDNVFSAVRVLEETRDCQPAFVIINISIFLARGEALLAWMREQPYLKQVPIIAIGESDRPQDVQRAYDLGANAYFQKQIDMNGLAQMIRELRFLEVPSAQVNES